MPEESTEDSYPESNFNPDDLPDLLPLYYKRLFPHKPLYRWLSYGHSENSIFTNREITYTNLDGIYFRYNSYENQNEFEKAICDKSPAKIDIGPVMQVRPKDHRLMAKNNVAVQRELVFDIDMDAYNEVRTCCTENNVCQKCWKFMSVACRILDAALREDFGFEHILWVFSGRRGIHCWVCDKRARHLNDRARASVADYLSLIMGTGQIDRMSRVSIGTDKIHHSVKRALRIIEPVFEEIIICDQKRFDTATGIAKLLQFISDENIFKDLEPKLKAIEENNSKIVWDTFTRHISVLRAQGSLPRKLNHIIEEIQLALLYPRLDINVSKTMNHLLKSPFAIHQKTGKVCVPFNPTASNKFDLTKVPTINQLIKEINAFDEKNFDDEADEKLRIKDYKKTSMFKGVIVFEEFLRKLEASFKGKARAVADERMDF